MFWNFISSLPLKRGGSLSFLTIFTFAIPELLDLISGLTLEGDSGKEVTLWMLTSLCTSAKREVEVAL
jgi:hypothetical protein